MDTRRHQLHWCIGEYDLRHIAQKRLTYFTPSSKLFLYNPDCCIKSREVQKDKCIVLLNKDLLCSEKVIQHFPMPFSPNVFPSPSQWKMWSFEYIICMRRHWMHENWFIFITYRICVWYHCVFVYKTVVRLPATLSKYRRHHQPWKNSQHSNNRLIYISAAYGVMKVNDRLYFLHIYLSYPSAGFMVNLM